MTELGIYPDTLCIIGKGSSDKDGYKRKTSNGKRMSAHRFAWEETHGPIPAGMCVCHRCDNPPCVNVEHLFVGTIKDNMRDRDLKGRGRNPQLNKTTCPEGHPYNGINNRGARICWTCKNAQSAACNARKKAARGI